GHCRRMETALAWIDRLAAEATSARKLIDHLDQAVLVKAFRGELVPQDPNDEPASVVLSKRVGRSNLFANDGLYAARSRLSQHGDRNSWRAVVRHSTFPSQPRAKSFPRKARGCAAITFAGALRISWQR